MRTIINTNRFKVIDPKAAKTHAISLGLVLLPTDDANVFYISADIDGVAPTDEQLETLAPHLDSSSFIVFDIHCIDEVEDVETMCRWTLLPDGTYLTAQELMNAGLAALGMHQYNSPVN